MSTEAAVPGLRIGSIIIDCHDPVKLAFFWKAVTGFEQTWEEPFVPDPEGDNWMGLRDPSGRHPNLGFQKVPEHKVAKNRVHMDLYVDDEEIAAERIVALGASHLWRSPSPADPFIVLADPEDNEFCVVRAPQAPSQS